MARKAQAGINTFQCPIVVGYDKRGRKILCYGTGFWPITLRQLARIRTRHERLTKTLRFHCYHSHQVTLE